MSNKCLECKREFGTKIKDTTFGLIVIGAVERQDPEIDFCSDCLQELEMEEIEDE